MSEPITVAAFESMADAEEAVRKLIDGGVSAEIISIVAKDMQCEKLDNAGLHLHTEMAA